MNYPMIENADEKLREICTKGINRKYNGDLKNTARLRLDQELAIVERQGSASGYLTVINALRAAGAEAEEIFFCGCMASSVLSYAAGLSCIDPLTADPKLYSEFYFGLHGEYTPAFELRVTKEHHDRLVSYFESYPGPKRSQKESMSLARLLAYSSVRWTKKIRMTPFVSRWLKEETGLPVQTSALKRRSLKPVIPKRMRNM